MSAGFYVVILIVLLAGVSLLGKFLNAGMNKGINALSNASKRAQEQNNPPKSGSLADRYVGVRIPDYPEMYGLTVKTPEADPAEIPVVEATGGGPSPGVLTEDVTEPVVSGDAGQTPAPAYHSAAFDEVTEEDPMQTASQGSYGPLSKKLILYGFLVAFIASLASFLFINIVSRISWSYGLFTVYRIMSYIAPLSIAASGAGFILRYLGSKDKLDLMTGVGGIAALLASFITAAHYNIFAALIVGLITGAIYLFLAFRVKEKNKTFYIVFICTFAAYVAGPLVSAIMNQGYYGVVVLSLLLTVTAIIELLGIGACYLAAKKEII